MSGVTATVGVLGFVGILVILVSGGWSLFIVPIAVVVLLVALGGPVLRFITERGQPGTDEPGVPTTREASYEPVEPRRPSEQ